MPGVLGRAGFGRGRAASLGRRGGCPFHGGGVGRERPPPARDAEKPPPARASGGELSGTDGGEPLLIRAGFRRRRGCGRSGGQPSGAGGPAAAGAEGTSAPEPRRWTGACGDGAAPVETSPDARRACRPAATAPDAGRGRCRMGGGWWRSGGHRARRRFHGRRGGGRRGGGGGDGGSGPRASLADGDCSSTPLIRSTVDGSRLARALDLDVEPPFLDSLEQLLALQSQFFRQLVNTRGQRQLLPEPAPDGRDDHDRGHGFVCIDCFRRDRCVGFDQSIAGRCIRFRCFPGTGRPLRSGRRFRKAERGVGDCETGRPRAAAPRGFRIGYDSSPACGVAFMGSTILGRLVSRKSAGGRAGWPPAAAGTTAGADLRPGPPCSTASVTIRTVSP